MSDSNSSGGIGFAGMLTIVFIALKLTHYIGWSWWWVLSPLWLPIAIVLPLLGLVLLCVKVYCDIRGILRDRERIRRAGL